MILGTQFGITNWRFVCEKDRTCLQNVTAVCSLPNVAEAVRCNLRLIQCNRKRTHMSEHDWINEFPAAITVCDANGIILEMNDKSAPQRRSKKTVDEI